MLKTTREKRLPARADADGKIILAPPMVVDHNHTHQGKEFNIMGI
jgi:hypothetical protein